MIPLFEQYPRIKEKLPYVALGTFPTPTQKAEALGKAIGIENLYIKRDDLSGSPYGGNKVRKLEFLLGRALRDSEKEVLTFGCAGSNHALATALYAKKVGLRSISMLLPQPNAHYVRTNLLASYSAEAELHAYRSIFSIFMGTLYQGLRHRINTGSYPQVIPLGGSSPLGCVGFVNAAFELKKQIINGELPEPDYVYAAMGTMGTAVGLILGLKAAHLRIKVVPVRVVPHKIANINKLVKLFRKTNELLNSSDPSFGDWDFKKNFDDIRDEFLGKGYAHYTREGMEAVKIAEQKAGLKLDGTYTGKTFAAIVKDGKEKEMRSKVVLFWNTKNSDDITHRVTKIDYHNLPKDFHVYFEKDVQALEREYSG